MLQSATPITSYPLPLHKSAVFYHSTVELVKKPDKFLKGKPSQNYGVSPKYGAHTILLAARHKRAHPALTRASESWYSIYLPQKDGRLSWPSCLITRRPEIEPMTARSEVRHPNHCAKCCQHWCNVVELLDSLMRRATALSIIQPLTLTYS